MKHYDEKQMQENILYLEALSEQYPNIQSAAAEMINLHAILDLPKGTEHFLSDIHGEHEAFRHILNNASGSIREKIDDLFSNTLTSEQRAELATLIYYPKEKLSVYKSEITDIEEWYRLTLIRLLAICRHISSKYTRSKVRKTLPKHYAYIIEELMFGDSGKKDRETYHENILHTIIEAGQADVFILSLCDTIKRLIVDKLHIVGDIFDRGARPDIVLDDLMMHHGVDIQWGNHDILWMGAASGSMACIAAALNNAFSYGNLDTIEVGYGISLRDLSLFAKDVYGGGNVERFMPKGPFADSPYTSNDPLLVADMHKAIAVILFKLEGQLVSRNPNFNMSDRRLLDKIDFENATVTVGEKKYPISDTFFPTVDHDYPYELTKTEKRVMEQLK
ncbi:MAG: fructose-bisphosphatase class III, partial [Ruminococcus bromii]